jgi:hypothetical protein
MLIMVYLIHHVNPANPLILIDAWVFWGVYYSTKNKSKLNISKIIGACDYLDHSIPTRKEIITALKKLQKKNIIQIENGILSFTNLGKKLIKQIESEKNTKISRIDIALQILNLQTKEYPIINEIDNCSFITKKYFKDSYDWYITKS